jgi:hypothetical protein
LAATFFRSSLAVDLQERADYLLGMRATAEKIVSEALELPLQLRAFVAEQLLESLETEPGDELSPAWREEIRKRCREIDQGLVEMVDAEAAMTKARAALE